MLLAITLTALVQSSGPANGITRAAILETVTMVAATVEYAPGASEPAGNHGYDVVVVPVDEGMSVELEGQPVPWQRGIPILISRGAPHRLANPSNERVRFVEVRASGDQLAGNDATVSASAATIVRSTVGKYIRASVLRFERGGWMSWPTDTVDGVLIVIDRPANDGHSDSEYPLQGRLLAAQPAFARILCPRDFRNAGSVAFEVVRVSRMASR